MAAEEMVVIVDEANHVVGSATRAEMRRRQLPHRATYILVFHPDGRLHVQRRTMNKDVYPGLLDPAAGGVVLAGESYEESAVRELEEEMGITGVALEPLFEFWFFERYGGVWGKAFRCTYDGPLRLQAEEVVEVVMHTPAELLAMGEAVTPDGRHVLERCYGAPR
jgi:8-oxo-dGTP pyrophosphatase MutT (NUDIX family)